MAALLMAVGMTACFFGFVTGYRLLRGRPDVAAGELEVLAAAPTRRRKSPTNTAYITMSRRLAPRMLAFMGDRWRERTAKRLLAAGRPDNMTVADFAGRKFVFVLFGGVLALVFVIRANLFLAIISLAIGFWYLDIWLALMARRRQGQIDRVLPDFLDVLSVTVSAGLAFRAALARVAETLEGPLAEEMTTTLRRMDVGVSRRQAFDELRERNPGSTMLAALVTGILQAEELGTPLTGTLVAISADMRRDFAQEARRRAARAVPRVSLVVTMVMVPAILLVVVVGLFLGSNVDLHGIFKN